MSYLRVIRYFSNWEAVNTCDDLDYSPSTGFCELLTRGCDFWRASNW